MPALATLRRSMAASLIHCPACGGVTTVIDSRAGRRHKNTVRRRRYCLACSLRFTTHESIESADPAAAEIRRLLGLVLALLDQLSPRAG